MFYIDLKAIAYGMMSAYNPVMESMGAKRDREMIREITRPKLLYEIDKDMYHPLNYYYNNNNRE